MKTIIENIEQKINNFKMFENVSVSREEKIKQFESNLFALILNFSFNDDDIISEEDAY